MNDPAPLPYVPGSTTIAVLPDTQGYSKHHPELFLAQTEWIARMRDARRIAAVLHLGDIVDDPDQEPQWRAAKAALSRLDGVVPYVLSPGNHDYFDAGKERRTLLNQYVDVTAMAAQPGCTLFESGKAENSCLRFEAGGQPWMALALEWAPRNAVVAWAGRMLAAHPDRQAIITTHAYLYSDGTRYDHTCKDQNWNPHLYQRKWDHDYPGGANDGEELWNKLVRRHANVAMVINGHVLHSGLAYLASAGDAGNTVHQMLVNFQMHERGGDAFLRLIEILPDGRTVQVKAYSPALDRSKTDPANQFTFTIGAPARARAAG